MMYFLVVPSLIQPTGDDNVSVTSITSGQVIPLLAAYLFTVAEGANLQAKTDLTEQTLAGYLGAAHAWLETVLEIIVPIHSTAMGENQTQSVAGSDNRPAPCVETSTRETGTILVGHGGHSFQTRRQGRCSRST